jgi:predicted CopG family antitoxin
MGNMTLSMPDELLKKMRSFNEIRWSEVARKAIERRVNDLEIMNKLASKSKLTENDVREISKRIKTSATKKF